MTSLLRARLYDLRANNPGRGLAWAIALIFAGLVLLALLQNYFAFSAALVGAGYFALWAHRVFTSRIKRAKWQRVALVGGCGIAVVVYAFWRGSPIPAVASAAIITLTIRAYGAVRTPSDADSPGFAAYLRALMLTAYAGLVFTWPRLSVYFLVLIAVAFLIAVGARAISAPSEELRSRAISIKDAATSLRMIRLTRARIMGRLSLAALTVGAIVASFFILGGAPEREVGESYATPDNMPTEVGQLISSEPYFRGVPDDAQAWLILYSTRNSADEIVAGSAVVIAPKDRDDSPLPSVSIAPGTNGIATQCAPSLRDNMFLTAHEHAAAHELVPQGWAGVITDYVGLGTEGMHAYMDGETAAKNVLDSRRAAAQLSELEVSDETTVWGHSQGGNASLWVGAIADEYAPDLHVNGVAAAAPAADLASIAPVIANDTAGKIITSYMAQSWDEVFDIDLDALRTPGYSQVAQRIADRCFEGRDAIANLADASQLSSPLLRQITPEFQELLGAKTPPPTSSVPVLIAQGDADQLVRARLQRNFVNVQCDAGQIIDYRTYRARDHMPLVEPDSPYIHDLIEWTQDRLNDAPSPSQCVTASNE